MNSENKSNQNLKGPIKKPMEKQTIEAGSILFLKAKKHIELMKEPLQEEEVILHNGGIEVNQAKNRRLSRSLTKLTKLSTKSKIIGKIFGNILWVGSGAVLLILWILKMTGWIGSWGAVLAIILSPGAAVFPIVYWIVEGVFPLFYFILWSIGLAGLFIKIVCSD